MKRSAMMVGLMAGAALALGVSERGSDGTAQAQESDDYPGPSRGAAPAVFPATPVTASDADEREHDSDTIQASTGAAFAHGGRGGAATAEASGKCPAGMVEVDGDYCPTVEQTCLRWADPETKMRCAEFAPTKCDGKTAHKHFCIDQFEYPNKAGEKPVVMKSWYEAKAACESTGKRLCGESEWTLACEGQERLPYPYGYARNAEACNIDKPHPEVNEAAIADPKRRDAEVARLDQRDPSGAREACVSPYGVHDMTGNVDEWVVNESGHPFKSGLKGGYWGPVRTRCRPMTTAHNEDFQFYQIGFRCCDDAPGAAPGPGTNDLAKRDGDRAAPAPKEVPVAGS